MVFKRASIDLCVGDMGEGGGDPEGGFGLLAERLEGADGVWGGGDGG